jgi:hypothetical protein
VPRLPGSGFRGCREHLSEDEVDQTNDRKSVDQVLALLQVLDCDVDLVVGRRAPDEGPNRDWNRRSPVWRDRPAFTPRDDPWVQRDHLVLSPTTSRTQMSPSSSLQVK